MGQVWRATDTKLNRQVALRIPFAHARGLNRIGGSTPVPRQEVSDAQTEYRHGVRRRGGGVEAGPPMSAGGYNNHLRLLQTPSYVVIWTEQIHDARIIPMDGRPPIAGNIRQWMGSSRGHWEGDTLVVETTHFNGKASHQGSSEGLQPLDGEMYEFACHEGNYGMFGILSGARAEEKAPTASR